MSPVHRHYILANWHAPSLQGIESSHQIGFFYFGHSWKKLDGTKIISYLDFLSVIRTYLKLKALKNSVFSNVGGLWLIAGCGAEWVDIISETRENTVEWRWKCQPIVMCLMPPPGFSGDWRSKDHDVPRLWHHSLSNKSIYAGKLLRPSK